MRSFRLGAPIPAHPSDLLDWLPNSNLLARRSKTACIPLPKKSPPLLPQTWPRAHDLHRSAARKRAGNCSWHTVRFTSIGIAAHRPHLAPHSRRPFAPVSDFQSLMGLFAANPFFDNGLAAPRIRSGSGRPFLLRGRLHWRWLRDRHRLAILKRHNLFCSRPQFPIMGLGVFRREPVDCG